MSFHVKFDRVVCDFGKKVSKTLSELPAKQGNECPVYVYRLQGDQIVEDETLRYTDSFFVHNDFGAFVGYDIETQGPFTDESGQLYTVAVDANGQQVHTILGDKYSAPCYDAYQLVSQQWYFNVFGRKLGVILFSERRWTDSNFTNFLTECFAAEEKVKTVYVAAHFSIVEAGWLVPSLVNKKVRNKESGAFEDAPLTANGKHLKNILIPRKHKQWCKEFKTQYRRSVNVLSENSGKRRRKNVLPAVASGSRVSKLVDVTFKFVDSMNLFPESLAKLGERVGIPKLQHSEIERMAAYAQNNPKEFCRYALRDSVITAEAFAWTYKLYAHEGLKFQSRIAAYSAAHFNKVFKGIAAEYKLPQPKSLLGYEQFQKEIKPDKSVATWRLSQGVVEFLKFYYGGRNDAHVTGAQDFTRYYDLKSAYPTAVGMLNDYRFDVFEMLEDSEAEKFVDQSMDLGPFQIIGVIGFFRFREGVEPIFPVHSKFGLVFPQSGYGPINWPEFWTAMKYNALAEFRVQRVFKFQRLDSRMLGDECFRLLSKRKDPKLALLYKNLLNYFYGKTAQGVKELQERLDKGLSIDDSLSAISSIACFPLAAYMTSFCRAVVGELLLEGNRCYGITTDGFISPESDLKTGHICKLVQEKFDELNLGFQFVGVEFEGDKSLFLKTRGYVIVNSAETDPRKRFKTAAMGIQKQRWYETPEDAEPIDADIEVRSIVDALRDGQFDKTSWPSFTQRSFDEPKFEGISRRDWKPIPRVSVAHVNTTYDLKRLPVSIEEGKFIHNDISFDCLQMVTKPLKSIDDFYRLRRLAGRNLKAEDVEILLSRFDFSWLKDF